MPTPRHGFVAALELNLNLLELAFVVDREIHGEFWESIDRINWSPHRVVALDLADVVDLGHVKDLPPSKKTGVTARRTLLGTAPPFLKRFAYINIQENENRSSLGKIKNLEYLRNIFCCDVGLKQAVQMLE